MLFKPQQPPKEKRKTSKIMDNQNETSVAGIVMGKGGENCNYASPKNTQEKTEKLEGKEIVAVYTNTDGLRHILPYFFTYSVFAKGRWLGKNLLQGFISQFQGYSPSYGRSAIRQGHLWVERRRRVTITSSRRVTNVEKQIIEEQQKEEIRRTELSSFIGGKEVGEEEEETTKMLPKKAMMMNVTRPCCLKQKNYKSNKNQKNFVYQRLSPEQCETVCLENGDKVCHLVHRHEPPRAVLQAEGWDWHHQSSKNNSILKKESQESREGIKEHNENDDCVPRQNNTPFCGGVIDLRISILKGNVCCWRKELEEEGVSLSSSKDVPSQETSACSSFLANFLQENVVAVSKPCGLPVHTTGRYSKNTVISILKTQLEGRRTGEEERGESENENLLLRNKRESKTKEEKEEKLIKTNETLSSSSSNGDQNRNDDNADGMRRREKGQLLACHRLDMATSGVLLFAKTSQVAGMIGEALQEKSKQVASALMTKKEKDCNEEGGAVSNSFQQKGKLADSNTSDKPTTRIETKQKQVEEKMASSAQVEAENSSCRIAATHKFYLARVEGRFPSSLRELADSKNNTPSTTALKGGGHTLCLSEEQGFRVVCMASSPDVVPTTNHNNISGSQSDEEKPSNQVDEDDVQSSSEMKRFSSKVKAIYDEITSLFLLNNRQKNNNKTNENEQTEDQPPSPYSLLYPFQGWIEVNRPMYCIDAGENIYADLPPPSVKMQQHPQKIKISEGGEKTKCSELRHQTKSHDQEEKEVVEEVKLTEEEKEEKNDGKRVDDTTMNTITRSRAEALSFPALTLVVPLYSFLHHDRNNKSDDGDGGKDKKKKKKEIRSRSFLQQSHSIVLCIPMTGRPHQLRVHLASLGYPIVDDFKYNCSFVDSSVATYSNPLHEDWSKKGGIANDDSPTKTEDNLELGESEFRPKQELVLSGGNQHQEETCKEESRKTRRPSSDMDYPCSFSTPFEKWFRQFHSSSGFSFFEKQNNEQQEEKEKEIFQQEVTQTNPSNPLIHQDQEIISYSDLAKILSSSIYHFPDQCVDCQKNAENFATLSSCDGDDVLFPPASSTTTNKLKFLLGVQYDPYSSFICLHALKYQLEFLVTARNSPTSNECQGDVAEDGHNDQYQRIVWEYKAPCPQWVTQE